MGKLEERNGLQTNNWRRLTLILKGQGWRGREGEKEEETNEDLCNVNQKYFSISIYRPVGAQRTYSCHLAPESFNMQFSQVI